MPLQRTTLILKIWQSMVSSEDYEGYQSWMTFVDHVTRLMRSSKQKSGQHAQAKEIAYFMAVLLT